MNSIEEQVRKDQVDYLVGVEKAMGVALAETIDTMNENFKNLQSQAKSSKS